MRMLKATLTVLLVSGCVLGICAQSKRGSKASAPEWPGWGGPHRDFIIDVKGIASWWPNDGPKRLWTRPLGEGHSSIVVDNGRLYTMFRPSVGKVNPTAGAISSTGVLTAVKNNRYNAEEAVIALDAASGKTIWEYRFPMSLDTLDFTRGAGPHVTPLIVGDRLFAASTDKQFLALDKWTGKVLWQHNFVKEYGAPPNQMRWPIRPGYAPSPIAHKENVIAMVGGPGQGVVAFRQNDGRIVWRAGEFSDVAPASPFLITLDGQEQLIVTSGDGVHGLDPNDGKPLWNHLFPTNWGVHVSTPVWTPADRLLFVSSAYDNGGRVVELVRSGGRTEPKELWFTNRMRVHFGNVLRLGDYYYGSSGDFGPAILTAIHARTGEIAWRDRTFAKASFLYADDKVILLDEDGNLALVNLSERGLSVLAKAEVATAVSWTVPTLVNKTLYLRDRVNIMAFDIGAQ